MQPVISLIIPTKNEEHNLGRCLKSITTNGYPNYEVVVVDQHSTDRTVKIAKFYKATVIQVPQTKAYLPPSTSRNVGFGKSHGRYIYHLDADMELQKGLLDEIVKKFTDPTVAALIVPEVDVPGNFWSRGKALERSFYFNTPMEAARVSRREIFEKFRYAQEITSGEDWYVHDQFYRFGSINHTTLVVHHHIGNITLRREIDKKTYYGKGSKQYLSTNISKTIKLFILLIPIYAKGIVVNLWKDPLSVAAFIIVRIVDFVSLVIGLLSTIGLAQT